MLGGSFLLFLLLFYFFPSPPIRSGEAFSSVIFPLFLFFYLFFGCSDGVEREACVCDHGLERSDLCAEMIIIIIKQVINIVLNLIFESEPLRGQRSTIVRSIPYSKQDVWSAPQSENTFKLFFLPSSSTESY